jgi:hypothetical protein
MANEQLKRLFRRAPEINEADLELLQSRVQARLRASSERASADEDEGGDLGGSVATAVADDESTGSEAPGRPEAEASIDAPRSRARYLAIRATTYELPDDAVGVMADAKGSIWGTSDARSDAALTGDPSPMVVPADTTPAKAEPLKPPRPARTPRSKADRAKAPSTKTTRSKAPSTTVTGSKAADPSAAAIGIPRAKAPATGPAARKPRRAARPSAVRSVGLPYCPYCATLLDPAPLADRRCPRCREQIIVKRADGRAVYLTEASLAIFEAERRRLMHAGRWDRERRRWLAAAATADASADRIDRLAAAPISEAVVAASRALYVTAVERAFRIARRERRWEDASRTMRDHALVLFRIAGSPVPPPEEILKPHREGAAAALRGLGGMVREAELLGGKCCDACRADDGRTFPITAELRTPRLPHPGCPKGLCRCDWYLAVRDESLVRRHLRRRKRADTGQPQGA